MALALNQTDEDNLKQVQVAIYMRVSTTEQAVHGYSLGAQEQVIRKFCKERGYEVYHVYADEGISGKKTENRPAFQKMMSDARENSFDMVVVWKLSRLGRNNRDILNATEELYKNNIDFYSISEKFDISTSTGRLMLQLLGSFGEFERNQISENVKFAMNALVRDKKRFAGGRMIGYVSDKDEDGRKLLVIEEKEAEIVRRIYQEYANGKGYRAIANALNKQGYKTIRGCEFSSGAVKTILMNKTYGGYLEYGKYRDWDDKRRKGKSSESIVVEGSHTPIIDKVTFDMVQERLTTRKSKPQWNERGENLLTGLLRCPECGGPMAASNTTNTLKDGTKKRTRYYSCADFRNKGAHVCHANSIKADVAEKFVSDRLKEVVQVPELLEKLIRGLNNQMKVAGNQYEAEYNHLKSKELEIQESINVWNKFIEENPGMINEILNRIQELRNERDVINQKVSRLEVLINQKDEEIKVKDVSVLLNAIEMLIREGSKKEVKHLYQCFIKEITFNKETKSNIQMTLYFEEPIINQLNQAYSSAISRGDMAVFDLRHSVFLEI